jgi:hypothetical protein
MMVRPLVIAKSRRPTGCRNGARTPVRSDRRPRLRCDSTRWSGLRTRSRPRGEAHPRPSTAGSGLPSQAAGVRDLTFGGDASRSGEPHQSAPSAERHRRTRHRGGDARRCASRPPHREPARHPRSHALDAPSRAALAPHRQPRRTSQRRAHSPPSCSASCPTAPQCTSPRGGCLARRCTLSRLATAGHRTPRLNSSRPGSARGG